MASAIEAKGLTMAYGRTPVLGGLNLEVPEGSVYAFLGRNGSGKTTTIRLLLGLMAADSGTIRVLGLDPYRQSEELMERIGFVSEDRPFYEWMTVDETLRFVAAFYGTWDWPLTETLRDKLALPGGARVGALSRGMRGKLALVCALGHRPELLILDEPTGGLDAVVRKDFIERMIEVIAEEGRTILFSSHLIDEVERVADRVGILHEGRLILEGTVETVKETFCRVRASFDRVVADHELPAPVWDVQRLGREAVFIAQGFSDTIVRELHRLGARQVEVLGLSLEDIFVARTAGEVNGK